MRKISLKKLFGVIAIVVLSFSVGVTVFAQARSYEEQVENCKNLKSQFEIKSLGVGYTDFLPSRFCTANDLVTYVIQTALVLAGAFATIFIIVGGFWLLTSAGNEEQAEKGRKVLTNSVVGLVAIIMAFAIVRIVTGLLTGSPGASVTGGDTADPAGSPKNPDTRTQTGEVGFVGNSMANTGSPYGFSLSVPKSIVTRHCGNATPAATAYVQDRYGVKIKLGDLVDSGGVLAGSFHTAELTAYSYGQNGAANETLPVLLTVCGKSEGGWSVPIKAGSGASCSPNNNNRVTKINTIDCGSNQTCDTSSYTCVVIQ